MRYRITTTYKGGGTSMAYYDEAHVRAEVDSRLENEQVVWFSVSKGE